ncbi:MAG: Cof-type HAD-IIB family hydrolase [Lachnospiraceae bacterium]|nr:Cof-type HAD-IIB family hydrolase [Lachnospiraceae bacterium]
MIDLHVHSCCSDGTLTPEELVDLAMEKGLTAMALTDHDTMEGTKAIQEYADRLRAQGKKNVPEIIPGIELSTERDGKDVHVVGLYVNQDAPDFKKYIKNFVDSRDKRNEVMCERLRDNGVDITMEELLSRFPGAVITRAHYARLMMEKGYVRCLPDAFDKYIGDHAPCYVPREKVTPEQAVELILKADGIPVLAHPILYNLSDRKLESLVSDLKEKGLLGIEAVYSTYSPADERKIRALANKYRLLLSGGSDFHGKNKDRIDLGTGLGNLCVPEEFLDKIKLAGRNVLFSDLDGTLFLKDSTISSEMHRALKTMTDKGYRFVINSGRPLASVMERVVNLGFNFSNMFIISNNGGLIYDCENKKIIKDYRLSQDTIRKVVAMAVEARLHVHSYTENEIVGFEDDDELKFYRERIHMPFIKTDDIAGCLPQGSFKVQIISLDNIPALAALKDKILNALSDEVDAVFSNDQYLEIVPKGVSKGDAMLYLANWFPVSRSRLFAAGDEHNDMTMIQYAGTGIAMSNGCEDLKAAADIVTLRDNDHDGLLEVIEKYFV